MLEPVVEVQNPTFVFGERECGGHEGSHSSLIARRDCGPGLAHWLLRGMGMTVLCKAGTTR